MITNKRKREEFNNDDLRSNNIKIADNTIDCLPKAILARILLFSENKNTYQVNKKFHEAFNLSCLNFAEINSRNIERFICEKLPKWKNRVGSNYKCIIYSLTLNSLEDLYFISYYLLKKSDCENVYNNELGIYKIIKTPILKDVAIRCIDLQFKVLDNELECINDLILLTPRLERLNIHLGDIKTALKINRPTQADNFEIHISATCETDWYSLLIDIQTLPKYIKVVDLDISNLYYNKENDQTVIEKIIEASSLHSLTLGNWDLGLHPAIKKIKKNATVTINEENFKDACELLPKLVQEGMHIRLEIYQAIDDTNICLYNRLFENCPNIEVIWILWIDTTHNLTLPKNLKDFSCDDISVDTKLDCQHLSSLNKITILNNISGTLVVSKAPALEIAYKSKTAEVIIV